MKNLLILFLLPYFAFPNFSITDDGVLSADNIQQEIVGEDLQIFTAGDYRWAVTPQGIFQMGEVPETLKITDTPL